LAEVSAGKTLEVAAMGKGLSAASLGSITKQDLLGQSSVAVADAGFAGANGKIVGPVKSALGWHLLRIDGLDSHAARTLDQARGELVTAIAVEKRRAALADLTSGIEDGFDKGDNLTDRAKDLGVSINETKPLIADGHIYGTTEMAPAELAKLLKAAFVMDKENQPQLAEIEPGKSYMIFDVSQIATSAPAPLKEIIGDVTSGYMLEKGAASAKMAAQKLLAEVRKGKDLSAAVSGLGVKLPPVNPIAMGREQLSALGAKAPRPLVLMFSMAKGTIKMQAAPQNAGWLVVQLKDIQTPVVQMGDPLLVNAGRELGQIIGNEYAAQLRGAIRKDVGVTRNEVAIKAVVAQVTGGN
jgi:peptidyl-prolyl cis-trans isomerase D